MKKALLIKYKFHFLLLIALVGCKKMDTTPPVITLLGANPLTISLQAAATDPGATGTDAKDGDITSKITSTWSATNPNLNLKGIYTITYTVIDAAGNTTIAARKVNVVNDADFLEGTYNADDTCAVSTVLPYTPTFTSSTTVNKQFIINNFRGIGIGANVTASVGGTAIGSTFSWQTQAVDTVNTLSAATNTGNISNLAPVSFSFVYQWSSGGTTTENCTGMYIHQ